MRLENYVDLGLKYAWTEVVIPIKNEDRKEAIKWFQTVNIKPGDEFTIELKKKRKKRSLTANAYFWQLLNKLAVTLNEAESVTYKRLVSDYGVWTKVYVAEEARGTLIDAWGRQKDSSGWFAEALDKETVKLYYGTSVYNTKQMARIIDGLVTECKEQNIETLPPDELLRLKAAWGKEE